MSDGIMVTAEASRPQAMMLQEEASPTGVVDGATAGIFVERAGTRKIPLSGARLIFPKFTAMFQPKRPLEAQDAEMLRRNGRQEGSPLSLFRSNPDSLETRLAKQEQEQEVMVACSRCGTYEMRSEENDAVHQPFFCGRCDLQMSSGMVGSQGNLETLEEMTERDDMSHLAMEEIAAMAEDLNQMGQSGSDDGSRRRSRSGSSTRSRSRSRSPTFPMPPMDAPEDVPMPCSAQSMEPGASPIRRFIRRLSNFRPTPMGLSGCESKINGYRTEEDSATAEETVTATIAEPSE